MKFYTQTVENVLHHFASSESGLSDNNYAVSKAKYGRNILTIKGRPLWRKLVEPFANVFVAVLGVAALISIATGHAIDAIIVTAIIFVSAIIYYIQQFSTERVLRALKQHDVQKVNVRRNGKVMEVSSEELVPGDVILLGEGEKVPADARVMHAENIRTNEAMLTGESLPVTKHAHALEKEHPVYERTNMLFQGSFVVSGRVTAVVVATAASTEFGRLAALAAPTDSVSPAQQKIDQLVTRLISVISVVVIVAFGLALVRGMELLESLRFVLSLAVAAVPEGLPVAVTVVLVLGMRRLAKYKALTRSMKAIENIGIITTIASDKTGTLTKNKLSVQEYWLLHSTKKQDMALWASLVVNNTGGATGDPLDTALHEFAKQHHEARPHGRTFTNSFAFDQSLAMSGNVWQVGERYNVVIKGAPERILKASSLNELQRAEAEHKLNHFTGMGYRVIGIAEHKGATTPPSSLSEVGDDLHFIGLLAIADELRPEAAKAITAAQSAGITVRMITGDHAETAFAIGKQLSLVHHRDEVLDCRNLEHMSDAELVKKVRDIRVFARVVPEAKHRILGVLKTDNITAMTGDGVNDVPALTNAHVGIAMGSGSQIAKESGDIVLLDDNFATIVRAVEGGRIVYDNIRRMLLYMLTTTLAGVGTIMVAMLSGLPLPLVAVQILWINLVTDTIFAIPLGLEPAEEDVMQRPPRGVKQPILERHIIMRLLIVGATMAAVTLAIFIYALSRYSLEYAQTLAFAALVVAQWANAVNVRSEFTSLFKRLRVPNYALLFGAGVAILLQLLVLFGPLAGALYVVPVDIYHLVAAVVSVSIAVVAVAELHKWYCRRTVLRTS